MDKKQSFSYKLIISYRGTQYRGWQFQTEVTQTIQNHVQMVLEKIAKYQKFHVTGASRTDAGVHASGQVLKVTLPKMVDAGKLLKGMNSKLPIDIRVISCEHTDQSLNVSKDAISKEYHYYFTFNQPENAILSETVYFYPKSLDIELMRKACTLLLGKHNFLSFSSPGPNPFSTHREILSCSLETSSMLTSQNTIYYLKIQGNGFLKYMVRYLMGALWDIGTHRLTLEEFKLSLETGDTYGQRTKALPHGLHLVHINY